MASPPYNQSFSSSTSPPYPSNASLPGSSKKRGPDIIPPGPVKKRRKPSILSTTLSHGAHPLRQTSFPPDGNEAIRSSRSPSVDTMSMVSGSATGAPPKKRGRPRKNALPDDASSVTGGKALTAVSGVSGRGAREEDREEEPEDDDEDGEGGAVTIQARSQEEKEKESRNRAMLFECFDPMQQKRFEVWRPAKFSESVVRRLVNQTLSQSAPAGVINAVKFSTKMFTGQLIEKARKVQDQWLAASGESQIELDGTMTDENGERKIETRRGPLTPAHLREALRRIKLERGTDAAGLQPLWKIQQQSGAERFGIRFQGKRLLK